MRNNKAIAFLIMLGFSKVGFSDDAIQLRNRESFLIAPMIEGIDMCEEAIQEGINNGNKAIEYCHNKGFYNTERLKKLLNTFEPQGVDGKVVIGYTYGVSLLGYIQ